jgi:CspA family cold shock protein
MSASTPVPQPIEVAGTIKWFDPAKGFGFIVPDNGMADVLLNGTYLRDGGFQTAPKGARIVVEAQQHPNGLRACRLISMDESTAVPEPQRPPGLLHATVTPTSGLEPATVKWINRARGFAFLTRRNGLSDVFVHMITLRQCGIGELKVRQDVLVRYGPGPKGLMATEVRLP